MMDYEDIYTVLSNLATDLEEVLANSADASKLLNESVETLNYEEDLFFDNDGDARQYQGDIKDKDLAKVHLQDAKELVEKAKGLLEPTLRSVDSLAKEYEMKMNGDEDE